MGTIASRKAREIIKNVQNVVAIEIMNSVQGIDLREKYTILGKGTSEAYNFIRKHQAINCCPYELACPELKEKLNVPNKWLALIQLSHKNI